MSQMPDPNAFTPLGAIYTDVAESDFLNKSHIIEDALSRFGRTKTNPNEYPDYFDDMLKQLIDLIPLE